MPNLRISHSLETGWFFRQTGSQDGWLEVKRVPTNVHLDLMNHQLIPDPFIGLNEMAVERVAEKSGSYRVDLPPISRSEDSIVASVFEGLDTFAHARLNGETILTSDNMFTPYQVDITDRLCGENHLEFDFAPALLRAREIKNRYPEHQWVGFNGEMARLAVRKAQYHWGWDWGPVLMTAGPWRPVRLEVYRARISDSKVDYSVLDDLSAVNGTISAKVEGPADTIMVAVELAGHFVYEGTAKVQNGEVNRDFSIFQPSLWYPHGYGEPAPGYIPTSNDYIYSANSRNKTTLSSKRITQILKHHHPIAIKSHQNNQNIHHCLEADQNGTGPLPSAS